MAQAFGNYYRDFRQNAHKKGLRYTLSHGLSCLPAALGHILDTLFYLDGTIVKDKEAPMSGPFGFLSGIGFFLIGYLAGLILQPLIRSFSYFGYYCIDYPIDFCCRTLCKLTIPPFYTFMSYTPFYPLYELITEQLPTQMEGPFGFILGTIPHGIYYITTALTGLLTNVVQYSSDHLCDAIRSLYSAIGAYCCGSRPDKEAADKPAPPSPLSSPESSPKILRLADMEKEKDDELKTVFKAKINIFAVLGITRAQYEENQGIVSTNFKKLAPKTHSDRGGSDDQFKTVTQARNILTDRKKSKKYMKFYQHFSSHFTENPIPAEKFIAAGISAQPKRIITYSP